VIPYRLPPAMVASSLMPWVGFNEDCAGCFLLRTNSVKVINLDPVGLIRWAAVTGLTELAENA